MPMRRSWCTDNHIARSDTSRLLALIADPARSSLHLEDLASFMAVPVSAAAREEGDVVSHDSGVLGRHG